MRSAFHSSPPVIGFGEIGLFKIGFTEICTLEIGPLKPAPPQVRFAELSMRQIDIRKIRALQVGTPELGSFQ